MSDATTATKPAGPKWENDAKDAIKTALRRFQRPLSDLVDRDANEGDTRLLVTDFLCDALGYDKYEDLTTEFAVRGEFADYGVRIDKQLVAFIEVKRVAQKLNARHLRQVETYAVKEGLEWVILTNGQIWQAYHISAGTGQQVSTTLALEVDLLGDESPSKKTATLFHLHRSALKRNTIDELWKRQTATAPAALASVLTADTVLDAIRKEIRRGSGFNADPADIATTLTRSVIRGELLSAST
ncbi:type I restriction enzyme HsdR N-terminal domain-containing protein [Microbacterium sp. MYb64]|uniref:type I restriction enzyme HsdR N-terminal domain-containing protein n=1 Tax=Microbacterium sp. MYb64 TaxID=1848691 RepID=UPI0015E2BD05|nr:type I restriction enzyme HsdR N-terminal domain-containing protein [Microbacterium sp. MYb64]